MKILQTFGVLVIAFGFLVGCKKDEASTKPSVTKKTQAATRPDDSKDSDVAKAAKDDQESKNSSAQSEEVLAKQVGIAPGPFAPDKTVGSDAVVSDIEGKAEIRPTGTEVFASKDSGAPLYAGDQIRSLAGTTTIVFADETFVEIAEDSVIAIGERNATADPALSVAVLYGTARFSVSPRAEGEGPFLAFASNTIVATKGTIFAIGVAASAAAKVVVESGDVDVVGAATLDKPVNVTGGYAIEVSAEGKLDKPQEQMASNWGQWRDAAEADANPKEIVALHGEALGQVEADIDTTYKDVTVFSQEAVDGQAKAESLEASADFDGYVEVQPELAVSIDAAYLATLRHQWLAMKMLSHAYIAHSIHVRHPEVTAEVYAKHESQVNASVLHHKKFHVSAWAHAKPLRPSYYVHHPRGRMKAKFVGVPVPKFYAKAKLRPVPVGKVRARVKFGLYAPPAKFKVSKTRKIHAKGPTLGWHKKARVKHPAVKGSASWYVRAKAPKAKLIAGAKIKLRPRPVFRVRSPIPRARVVARFGGPRARIKARARIKGPGVGIKAPRVRGKVGVGTRVHGSGRGGGRVGAKLKTKAVVKKKAVLKVRPPKIKLKAGGKASVKGKAKGGSAKGKVRIKGGAGIKIGR